jgi:hypothetical protein
VAQKRQKEPLGGTEGATKTTKRQKESQRRDRGSHWERQKEPLGKTEGATKKRQKGPLGETEGVTKNRQKEPQRRDKTSH